MFDVFLDCFVFFMSCVFDGFIVLVVFILLVLLPLLVSFACYL